MNHEIVADLHVLSRRALGKFVCVLFVVSSSPSSDQLLLIVAVRWRASAIYPLVELRISFIDWLVKIGIR